MKDCKKCNGDGYFYEADRRTPTRCECQNFNKIKTNSNTSPANKQKVRSGQT